MSLDPFAVNGAVKPTRLARMSDSRGRFYLDLLEATRESNPGSRFCGLRSKIQDLPVPRTTGIVRPARFGDSPGRPVMLGGPGYEVDPD